MSVSPPPRDGDLTMIERNFLIDDTLKELQADDLDMLKMGIGLKAINPAELSRNQLPMTDQQMVACALLFMKIATSTPLPAEVVYALARTIATADEDKIREGIEKFNALRSQRPARRSPFGDLDLGDLFK